MKPFLHTDTSVQQHELEQTVSQIYADLVEFDEEDRQEMLLLLRDRHTRYLQGGLGQLPSGFVSLDASKPWICFWVLHGLALLQAPLPQHISSSEVVAFLASCQDPAGGYGGGPRQVAHLAPTYAAVSALLTLGGQTALSSIDRQGVWGFLNRMAIPAQQGGGFRMHDGGESDVRSCYTAMAVATGLCLDARSLAAKAGMVDYIRRCQTYEGGIGGEPGNEAHGGYTYCGVAALALVGCAQALNVEALLHWATQRQGWVEGGFNGRTNKLVDGCYSYWQGGVFPILQQILGQQQQQQQQIPSVMTQACTSFSYPPPDVPGHWQEEQQQQQQQQRQQQALVVPEPPDLSQVQGPVDKAQVNARVLNEVYDTLADAAIESNAVIANDGAGVLSQGHQAAVLGGNATLTQEASSLTAQQQQQHTAEAASTAELPSTATGSERNSDLLERAKAAGQAAEYADQMSEIAALSAAVLAPCAAGEGSGGGGATAAAHDINPLFNTKALQLWILRGCQQLKGGLRDKPGKSADYYHTCYCLSGLSAAQHIPGGSIVGPVEPSQNHVTGTASSSMDGGQRECSKVNLNQLAVADPLLNVVVEKVREAKKFFEAAAPVI